MYVEVEAIIEDDCNSTFLKNIHVELIKTEISLPFYCIIREIGIITLRTKFQIIISAFQQVSIKERPNFSEYKASLPYHNKCLKKLFEILLMNSLITLYLSRHSGYIFLISDIINPSMESIES